MKSAAERAESYKTRIIRAQEWQKFYAEKGTEAGESLRLHWECIEINLKQRLYEANLEIANENKLYDVYLNESYVGYSWARSADEAINNLVGDSEGYKAFQTR